MTARYLALVLALVAWPPFAFAERCRMVGCEGNIGYVLIPHPQYRGAAIFRQKGLPTVNSLVTVNGNLSVLDPSTIPNDKYIEQLKSDVLAASKKGVSLDTWGSILESGATARVLGYTTFPQLGPSASELFMLIQVIKE